MNEEQRRERAAAEAQRILSMTPDEHRREAARLMAIRASITNEAALLLRAQLHLQFAAGGAR